MLYSYNYLKGHSIEGIHKHIRILFKVLNKTKKVDFSLELLDTEFRYVISRCEKLNELINAFVNKYYRLEKSEQAKIYKAFVKNNLIRKICEGTIEPILAESINKEIFDEINELFKYLYNDFLKTKECERLCNSNLLDYFQEFLISGQAASFCPFCGLVGLNTQGRKYRDDYDHYLPKSKYLFNSVNFKNLTPMCHTCNSKVKLSQPMIYKNGSRRKVLYPYDNKVKNGDVTASIDYGSTSELQMCVNYPEVVKEEMESWIDIFDINNRYTDLINNDKLRWFEWIKEDYKIENEKYQMYLKTSENLDPAIFIKGYIRKLETMIDAEKMFLQIAYVKFVMNNESLLRSIVESISTAIIEDDLD